MWLRKLKIKKMNQLLAEAGALGLLLIPAVASAQVVAQAYGVTGSVQTGMIVMLDPKNSNNIEPLTNKHDSAMLGVTVQPNDSAVTLSGDGTATQTYVASTGSYQVLVSNQNGPIKPGDIISISAVDGVGMKADANESVVLGKALDSFNGTNGVNGTTRLTTSNGSQVVSIGLIHVSINIGHNPLNQGAVDAAAPSLLRHLAQSIAGKPVSTARIYIGLAVLLATLLIAGSLLYGGVRSSLLAIGRNPLARSAVFRGLVQVLLLGVVLFAVGLAAIYLLLKA